MRSISISNRNNIELTVGSTQLHFELDKIYKKSSTWFNSIKTIGAERVHTGELGYNYTWKQL